MVGVARLDHHGDVEQMNAVVAGAKSGEAI
jgi:hypothetical protein